MTDPQENPTRKIVIVGAGAAGVFTAYRLRTMYGDAYDIVLLEKNDRIGGNTYTKQVDYFGERFSIDCGAQFFYKEPQASYVQLLEDLGIADDPTRIIAAPTGFTIWNRATRRHAFWMPTRLADFGRYTPRDWSQLVTFGRFLERSLRLDRADPSNWTLSVDDWLDSLGFASDAFKRDVIKPFLYQFVSLPLSRIGEASALYAITYFVRSVFGEVDVDEPEPDTWALPGVAFFKTYQSLIGLDGIMKLALAQVGVQAQLGTPALSVRPTDNGVVVHTAHGPIVADHVVLACDPIASARLLAAGGTAEPGLIETLRALEYIELPISIQRDGSAWMPHDTEYWSGVNTIVDGDRVVFTAWFGPLRTKMINGAPLPVFKSWAAPNLDVGDCPDEFFRNQHYIPLPTTTFVGLRDELIRRWQGRANVWFVGGWTNWFDSQEAALDSATAVADALPGAVAAGTGKARMVPIDHDRTARNVHGFLERMHRVAPPERQRDLAEAIEEVARSA